MRFKTAPATMRAALAMCIGIALVSCGESAPTNVPPVFLPNPLTIGPAGGMIQSPDGSLVLEIPAGALTAPVTFSIQTTTTHPTLAIGTVYQLGPTGTQFGGGATLRLRTAATLPSGMVHAELRIASANADGWLTVPTEWNATSGMLVARIPHLSKWGVVSEYQTEAVTCPQLQLAASTGMPLDQVAITGVPPTFGALLAARVFPVQGGDSSITFVDRGDGDTADLTAPIHPAGLIAGGAVRLRLIDNQGRFCQSVPFTIESLPSAPGTSAALLEAMRALVSQQAVLFGTSVEALRAADPAALPPHLLPLFIAQSTIDGPDNVNSLKAIVEGSSPLLSVGSPNIALADALLAHMGVLGLVNQRRASMPSNTSGSASRASTRAGTSNAPRAANEMDAAELDMKMNIAAWGRANTEGPAGDVLGKVGVVVALGGLVPNPVGKAASSVTGSALFGLTKGAEAAAKLLPSKFESIDYELSHPTLFEDDARTGQWHSVEVVASSEGWNLDRALLESLLQFVRAKGSLKSWMSAFEPDNFRHTLEAALRSGTVDAVVGTWGDAAGLVTIPPREFGPVDITAEPWSEAQVSFVVEASGRQGYRLNPLWTASDHGEIVVSTPKSTARFGNQFISRKRDIPALPIRITFNPTRADLKPGATATFLVTVANAFNPALEIHADNGMLVSQNHGDGTHTVSYTAPDSESGLPDLITARSTSATGRLANFSRPSPTGSAVIGSTITKVTISPGGGCVTRGGQMMFTAAVSGIANQNVTWSASRGSISASGVFTAPGSDGAVTITATSVAQSSLSASVTINVGSCVCSTTMNTSFAGSLGGDLTMILRAGANRDGALARIWLFFRGPTEDEDSQISVDFAAGEGPLPGQTGSYNTSLSGIIYTGPEQFTPIYASNPIADFFVGAPRYVTTTIEEFVQGPLPHQAIVRGRITGSVYRGYDSQGNILLGQIDARFYGMYDRLVPFTGATNCGGGGW